jgi:trimethylamine corrinoid protein
MSDETVFQNLKTAILDGDETQAAQLGKSIADKDEATLRKAMEIAVETIREVGDKFGTGEIFLPEMMLSADAMLAFTHEVSPALDKLTGEAKVSGKVVLGTVKGDIHSIGKDIVSTMLRASGFDVIDMGVDVSPMEMIKTAEQSGANIIGLSALMTTSMPYQKEVVDLLNELKRRDEFWIIVGGGPVTSDYAKGIGANGWAANAAAGARLCERLLGSGATPATAEFIAEEK